MEIQMRKLLAPINEVPQIDSIAAPIDDLDYPDNQDIQKEFDEKREELSRK